MFGAFHGSLVRCGGYLWKKAPRLSAPQKYRLRQRMRQVDENIDVIYRGLIEHQGKTVGEATGFKKIDYLQFEMPKEKDMLPKDKYTTFNKHARNYRKKLHLVPKWTKTSFRENPKYF
ncbi:54S ribosomal protein L31 mitochondrial [Spathaspora sp. JA1]|nr:54S ribosomal protein L31 mitochondrial [Spathaspora sp. JA1]